MKLTGKAKEQYHCELYDFGRQKKRVIAVNGWKKSNDIAYNGVAMF